MFSIFIAKTIIPEKPTSLTSILMSPSVLNITDECLTVYQLV